MKNIENTLYFGKFVIAPLCSKLNAKKIRKLSGADHVELIVEPDWEIYGTDNELYELFRSVNVAYSYIEDGCIHDLEIYKLHGNPNSEKLFLKGNSISCVEFDEAVLRDLQHNAYVAWHAERAKDHMLECWSDNAPSKGVFNQVGFTDLVNVAYVKAIKNFDTASDGLIKECAANMKAALAPTW